MTVVKSMLISTPVTGSLEVTVILEAAILVMAMLEEMIQAMARRQRHSHEHPTKYKSHQDTIMRRLRL